MSKEETTQQKILEAARAVFLQHGFDGARMQQIAEAAGVNKAMLHYYFRSKERLFEEVFQATAIEILPRLFGILGESRPFEENLKRFVQVYLDVMVEHPLLPGFMLRELSRNPARLDRLAVLDEALEGFAWQLRAAVAEGRIRPVEPVQLFLHLVGLCAAPFLTQPLLHHHFGVTEKRRVAFLEARKEEVLQFVRGGLGPAK